MHTVTVTQESLLSHERQDKLVGYSFDDVKDEYFTPLINRLRIIDTMMEIGNQFVSNIDTYILAINIFDTCIIKSERVNRHNAAVYAAVCLFIASKKYEDNVPSVDELSSVVCNPYNASIADVEQKILKEINFDVNYPNIINYIDYIIEADVAQTQHPNNIETRKIAQGIALGYYACAKTIELLPSVIATACCVIASDVIGKGVRSNPYFIPNDLIHITCKILAENLNKLLLMKDGRYVREKIALLTKRDTEDGFPLLFQLQETLAKYIKKSCDGTIHRSTYESHIITTKHKFTKINTFEMNEDSYTTSCKIGNGSYGTIHKIYNNESFDRRQFNGFVSGYVNNRHVTSFFALKRIYCEDSDSPISFIKEVSILANLQHKNIVKLIGVMGRNQIVLELMSMDIKTYMQCMKQHDCSSNSHTTLKNTSYTYPFSLQEKITRELLEGLVYMHSRGVYHSDIKPQNILVRGKWDELNENLLEIKYCDFGISQGINTVNTKIRMGTKLTLRVCTIWYKPIELLLGHDYCGGNVDVWSLVCTLYELFSGSVLFAGDSEISQIFKILKLLGSLNDDSICNGNHPCTKLPYYNKNFPKWKHTGISHENQCKFSKRVLAVIENGLDLNYETRATAADLLSESFAQIPHSNENESSPHKHVSSNTNKMHCVSPNTLYPYTRYLR